MARGIFGPLLAGLAAVAFGCAAPTVTPEPVPPTTPPGWTTFETATHDIRLTLPPWLVPHDTTNAIYALDPPGPVVAPRALLLMASGPAFMQPAPAQDALAWIDQMMEDTGSGEPVVTRVSLPAGAAVRYERIDRAGTPDEHRLLVFAIRTSSGYAWLQIDAPPEVWQSRAADIEWIPRLLRVS
jgi:hypothetical protein